MIIKEFYKTRDDGKWLYNETANMVSDKVYLGKEASANEWVEITEEEKQKIKETQYEKSFNHTTDD